MSDEAAAGVIAPAADVMQPLRDGVLSGRYFTAAHRATAIRVAEFTALPDEAALGEWFGAGRACLLARQRDGLRHALDRDIAAIDALGSYRVFCWYRPYWRQQGEPLWTQQPLMLGSV